MKPILKTCGLIFNNMIAYPDVEIASGQATFVVGKSGSGKSSLLKLFNGVLSPSAGKIFYEGRDIEETDTIALRRDVLLAGQSVFLFDGNIRGNFEKFYEYRELPALSDEEIARYMSICCADFPLDKNCTSMSGGEKQRIFLAVCLSFSPRVLMVDEPTAALDGSSAEKLIGNLIAYGKEKGMTMVIVSHDQSLTEKFAEKVIVLGGDL